MNIRIQDVIHALAAQIGEIPNSVDRLIAGNPLSEVKGIVVAFMATRRVLEQARIWGANLVVTHEGVFYSHRETGETCSDHESVHADKKRFIEDSGIAIYRLHDSLHRASPDGIMEGLIQALDWQEHKIEHFPAASVVHLPASTVGVVAEHVKQRLGLATLRLAGDLAMPCRRVGLLVGYRGGIEHSVPLFEKHNVDLVAYGEGPEWETPEYVRDAIEIGRRQALLVLGHLESEQPGMRLLADRLGVLFPSVPVRFCPVESVFKAV
ncbi:Nif3-like dinuclear metal center hexameric protein [Cohnella herbarum]|uniref:GTP cyclohydrolase 1 type 2 homolog n=1 Tax=Cohnella herbarum TaxID=2728023 RepID=A0A7Z2ZPY1_9BACL|nr:Nif3-like dinuclear metal center hexameric protein [Cohnella herbarum]QJD87380.1 transcriptional regulator [Cohnella herbarum]